MYSPLIRSADGLGTPKAELVSEGRGPHPLTCGVWATSGWLGPELNCSAPGWIFTRIKSLQRASDSTGNGTYFTRGAYCPPCHPPELRIRYTQMLKTQNKYLSLKF